MKDAVETNSMVVLPDWSHLTYTQREKERRNHTFNVLSLSTLVPFVNIMLVLELLPAFQRNLEAEQRTSYTSIHHWLIGTR